jgi:hypothetical protein
MEPIKVLILDIDGVLNSERSSAALGGYPHSFEPAEFAKFDPVALALLRKLVDATGALVVLSTSWRVYFTCAEVERAFEVAVLDATPDLGAGSCRADEITAWLGEHPEVTRFAIVDDMPMDFEHASIQDRFVQTNPMHGLGLEEYRQLRHLLTDNPP